MRTYDPMLSKPKKRNSVSNACDVPLAVRNDEQLGERMRMYRTQFEKTGNPPTLTGLPSMCGWHSASHWVARSALVPSHRNSGSSNRSCSRSSLK
jgi:hypothetical protein